MVGKLGVNNADERKALLFSLKCYPNAFSKDGKFSTQQLLETEKFFHTSSEGNPSAQSLKLESMVNDKWAGRSP